MKQQALAGFEKYGKTTRRAEFLAQSSKWCRGRSCAADRADVSVPLERMLRSYYLQA